MVFHLDRRLLLLHLAAVLLCSVSGQHHPHDQTSRSQTPENQLIMSEHLAASTNCDTLCQTINKHSTWMEDIFHDIDSVPNYRNYGGVTVFGDRALPILKRPNSSVVIMAAAEIGNGRVIVTGTDKYVTNIKASPSHPLHAFATNYKKWLTKGTFLDDSQLCKFGISSKMLCLKNANTKILYWSKGDWATEEQEKEVVDWIKAGGAMIWGHKPWAWRHYHPKGRAGEPFSSMGFHKVLKQAGILVTYPNYSDKIAHPVAKTAEERTALVNLHLKVAFENIQNWDDVATYSGLIGHWVQVIDISAKFYDTDLDRVCELAIPFAHRIEPFMKWPNATIHKQRMEPMSSELSLMYNVFYWLGHLGKWTKKQPNVERFPGDVSNPTPLEEKLIEIQTNKAQTFSTGMYLLPGQEMTIDVLSINDTSYKKFEILVGCHTDKLYHKTTITRYPQVNRYYRLYKPPITVKHWSGGLVFLNAAKTGNKYIKIRLTGLIKAPFIDLDDASTIVDWKNRRHALAPWADMKGKHMRYTITSDSVRNLDHPEEALAMWDDVVESGYDLKGTPETQRSIQWATSDIQISAGWLHAGNPIGMHSDKGNKMSKKFVLRKDNFHLQWGIFHEIGHNMQEASWTFNGTGEVTNNIFSLFQLHRLYQQDLFTRLTSTIKSSGFNSYLAKPSYLQIWTKPWRALLPYAQVAQVFGFDCYHKVFSTYSNKTGLPRNDQDEQDQWVSRWSHAVGYNLCPLYEFYSLPLTESMCMGLSYPPYLPTDMITQKPEAASLVAKLTVKYCNLVREITVKPDCPIYGHGYS